MAHTAELASPVAAMLSIELDGICELVDPQPLIRQRPRRRVGDHGLYCQFNAPLILSSVFVVKPLFDVIWIFGTGAIHDDL
jgi:hypothetical protein